MFKAKKARRDSEDHSPIFRPGDTMDLDALSLGQQKISRVIKFKLDNVLCQLVYFVSENPKRGPVRVVTNMPFGVSAWTRTDIVAEWFLANPTEKSRFTVPYTGLGHKSNRLRGKLTVVTGTNKHVFGWDKPGKIMFISYDNGVSWKGFQMLVGDVDSRLITLRQARPDRLLVNNKLILSFG